MSLKPGVVFDVDGTLVDTNYLHVVAWARVFQEAGIEGVPQAQVHRRVGMSGGRLVEELVGPGRDELKERQAEEFSKLRKEIRPLPGAADLLRAVAAKGWRVVLATSSKQDLIEALLEPLDADDAIDEVLNADDVDEAKPDPDVFESALRKGGIDPARAVVVGDTVWDVKAATRASLPCLCVASGGIEPSVLLEAGAIAVYDTPQALLEQRFARLEPGAHPAS
jgi:HAD superfamily hydrolase (TIGR01549 family)